MNIRQNLIIFFAIYFCNVHVTYSNELVNAKLNVGDDFPSSEMYHFYKDHKGYLWISSDRGLSRFDGKDIIVYDKLSGLGNSVVFELIEFTKNCVAITTLDNEIYFFDPISYPIQFKPYVYNDTLKKAISNFGGEIILDLWKEENGAMNFFLVYGGGRVRIDEHGNWVILDRGNDYSRNSIIVNQERLRVHYNRELGYVYSERVLDSLQPFSIEIRNDQTGDEVSFELEIGEYNSNSRIGTSDFEYQDSLLVFTFIDKLFFISEDTCYYESFDGVITGLLIKEKEIYIATLKGGYIYNQYTQTIKTVLENEVLSDVIVDQNKNIWFTSIINGLIYVPNKKDKRINSLNTAVFFHDILAINGFVCFVDFEHDLWVYKYSNRLEKVHEDVKISNEYLLASTKEDFTYLFNKENRLLKKVYSEKYLFWADTDINKSLFYTYKKDLMEMDRDTFISMKLDIPKMNDNISFGDSLLYIATNNGLYNYNFNGLPKLFDATNPILLDRFNKIEKFGEGFLLASYNYGLVYCEGENVYALGAEDGLASSTILDFEIIADSVIWVASYKGVDRLILNNKALSHMPKIEHFGKDIGLSSNEVMAIEVANDSLWILTKTGVDIMPLSIKLEPVLLDEDNFYLDSVLVNEKKQEINNTLFLEEGDDLRLFFNQVNLVYGSNFYYDYKVGTENKRWVKTQSEFLDIPRLKTGDYEIVIRSKTGVNVGGVIRLNIVVQPFFWKTLPAVLLYVLMFFLFSLLIVGFFFRRYKSKKQFQLDRIKLELKVLSSQVNHHFTFNTINSIQFHILENEQEVALEYLNDFATLVRQILDFLRREFISLIEVKSFLKLYVALQSRRFSKEVELRFRIDLIGSEDITLFPALLLQPIVENAIEHGFQKTENPKIYVQILEEVNFFHIKIEDNGYSLNSEKNNRSYGLEIVKDRLKVYNGNRFVPEDFSVLLGSEDNVGSCVSIRLMKTIIQAT